MVVHFPMHHTGLQRGLLKEKCHYENEIPHQHLTGYGMCAGVLQSLVHDGHYGRPADSVWILSVSLLARSDLLRLLRIHVPGGAGAGHIRADHDVARRQKARHFSDEDADVPFTGYLAGGFFRYSRHVLHHEAQSCILYSYRVS